jgi:hypothetical protein
MKKHLEPPVDFNFIENPELCRRIHRSRQTVHRFCKQGLIPYIKSRGTKGRLLFHWPSVEAALVKMQQTGGNGG